MAVWLQEIKDEMGVEPEINWRYFSLEQVNKTQGPEWKIWEQPGSYGSYGLNAFRAAEAARRQGDRTFDIYHSTLLKARHEQRRNIADINVLVDIAESVKLDTGRFREDFSDPRVLDRLASDHTAAEEMGIFGTPTLVFPGGHAVFVKLDSPLPSGESIDFLMELRRLAEQKPYVLEIKRPERKRSETIP